jgi:3,5-epimerase/4-reductase
MTEDTPPN